MLGLQNAPQTFGDSREHGRTPCKEWKILRTHDICTQGTAPAQTWGSTDLASGRGGRPGKGMSGYLNRILTPVMVLLYLTSSALTRGHVPTQKAITVSGLPAADLVLPDKQPRGNAFTWSDLHILTWAPALLRKERPFSPNTSKDVTKEGSYSKRCTMSFKHMYFGEKKLEMSSSCYILRFHRFKSIQTSDNLQWKDKYNSFTLTDRKDFLTSF